MALFRYWRVDECAVRKAVSLFAGAGEAVVINPPKNRPSDPANDNGEIDDRQLDLRPWQIFLEVHAPNRPMSHEAIRYGFGQLGGATKEATQ